MPFAPTTEQSAILEAFSAGKDLVVQAGAGTGKTTTLQLLANSTDAYGTYLAFNRAIAAEARRKMPHTVRALTAHSLAWNEYGKERFSARMDEERQGWTPTIRLLNAEPMSFRLEDRSRRNLSAYQMARHAVDTVKKFCQSDATTISVRHVPMVPGLDKSVTGRSIAGDNHALLCDRILPMARRAWADVQKTDGGVLAFDHAFYLKLWALTNPTLGGQYLMFDEAQDANSVLAGVVNRQKHLQRVFVGDSAQQIMAFAGARDAMQGFSRQPDVVTLTLSESFRFGPSIAVAANMLLDELDAPLRLTGTPLVESMIGSLDTSGASSDAVLCRTNAGALDEVITLQGRGRRVCLLGDSKDLKKFVEAARDLQTKGQTNHFSLMAFESWAQVEDHVASDQAGGDELETMVELVNQYGVDVLLKALSSCVHENMADVVISTAHKAKGREWDAVRVSPDFELDPEAPPEVRSAEMMLAYVAITRAKKVLDPGLLAEWIKAPVVTPAVSPTVPTLAPAVPVPVPSVPVVVPDSSDALSTFAVEVEQARDGSQGSGEETQRVFAIDEDIYQRLVAAAARWGGAPDEFAARLLDGALSALAPADR